MNYKNFCPKVFKNMHVHQNTTEGMKSVVYGTPYHFSLLEMKT
jgi:hypothetical protein